MYLNHLSYEFFTFKKLLDNWNIVLFQKFSISAGEMNECMYECMYVCIFPYISWQKDWTVSAKLPFFSSNFNL